MNHINNFKDFLNESNNQGGYSTEEMSAFIQEIVPLIKWTGTRDVEMTIPDAGRRNASAVSNTAEDTLSNWNEAVEFYGDEPNLEWYVWNVDAGGSFNKPKELKYQRYDIDSILDMAKKNPESIRRISVSLSSDDQGRFGDMMGKTNTGD